LRPGAEPPIISASDVCHLANDTLEESTMVLPQRATAEELFNVVPPIIAADARQYQRARATEQTHLAAMAGLNLLGEWTAEVRSTVLEAREAIQQAREARADFRLHVRQFVLALRAAREPLPAVLRHTRSMLQLLERCGSLDADGGWFEAEVLEWAIEEYESAA
jgi:hypothetical protein